MKSQWRSFYFLLKLHLPHQMLFFVRQGMAKEGRNQDPKRIFYSDVTDINELHVIVGKVTIVRVASKVELRSTLAYPIILVPYTAG